MTSKLDPPDLTYQVARITDESHLRLAILKDFKKSQVLG
jgi:hypothetical protein